MINAGINSGKNIWGLIMIQRRIWRDPNKTEDAVLNHILFFNKIHTVPKNCELDKWTYDLIYEG